MANRPNSDRSSRARMRAAERQIAQAGRTMTRAKRTLQEVHGVTPDKQAGIPISIQELMARIGTLTVERDYWQEQARRAVVEAGKLKAGEDDGVPIDMMAAEEDAAEAERVLAAEGPPKGEAVEDEQAPADEAEPPTEASGE